jgi:HPr kinase/phosphorylase
VLIHASSVALDGRAVLIRGASGSGKSALALQLMAFGARLIADDRTLLTDHPEGPLASAPATIRGRIEARGLGILAAAPADPAPVRLVVDLDRTETERLPPPRRADLLGHAIPLCHKQESPYFAAAILQYLKAGQAEA